MNRTQQLVLASLAIAVLTVPAAAFTGSGSGAVDVTHRGPAHTAPDEGFEVRLAAEGSAAVGDAFALVAAIHPEWDGVTSAAVSLDAPDGVTVRGPRTVHVAFPGGEPAEVRFLVDLDEPGDHRFEVTALGESPDGPPAAGNALLWASVPVEGEGAFFLDHLPVPDGPLRAVPVEDDSHLLHDPDAYDASLFGDLGLGLRVTPLPTVDAVSVPEDDPLATVLGGYVEATASDFRVTACWNYKDYDTGAWTDQRWATVLVMDEDSTSGDDQLWSGTTGTDGCFTSGWIDREECCWQGNQDVYLVFRMSNSAVEVDKDGAAGIYEFHTSVQTVGTQSTWNRGSFSTGSNHIAARQFQYANNAWDWGVNHASKSINWQVQVETPSDQCSGACYTSAWDTIHIPSARDGRPDVTAHEYGHFYMDKVYGSFWPSPGGSHSLCGDNQDRGLSWAEGFADFYGVVTNYEVNAPGADGDMNYQSTSMEYNPCSSSVQGDDNEWNVARTLWDLVDSNDDGETVNYSNFAVMDIVDDCNDDHFRDYYDGGSCSWTQHGYSSTNFKTAASHNLINY